MTPLVPIMLIGWVPFTIFLFFTLKPHRAVLISLIGGFLLLPHFSYEFQGMPFYNKNTAIALGLILGGLLSGQWQKTGFKWQIYDLPMALWCLSSIPTSLVNQLGLYDGLSASFSKIVVWGIPYLVGRAYFKDSETLLDLCRGIVIGGLIYLPLCLYEIRMSPQLSNIFYGFFPHSFAQHVRYDGYRPIVFMQHGLMVALWMAVTTTVAFWLWRSRIVEHIKGIPMGFIVMALAITTVLCKSAGGIVIMILGCSLYFVYRHTKTYLAFAMLILMIPVYISLRISGIIKVENVTTIAAYVFDRERTGSLGIRLVQEDLFIQHTLNSALFGWGAHGRNWPELEQYAEQIHRTATQMIDALWLIVFSINGFFGLFFFLVAMLLGPWLIVKKLKNTGDVAIPPVLIGLVVFFFMLDSLLNGMINPVYIICTGVLITWSLPPHKQTGKAGKMLVNRQNINHKSKSSIIEAKRLIA